MRVGAFVYQIHSVVDMKACSDTQSLVVVGKKKGRNLVIDQAGIANIGEVAVGATVWYGYVMGSRCFKFPSGR